MHALGRDVDRLADWDRRTALSPLGAGALAGSSLPLDPQATAAELGFDGAVPNSIDAVSDRDFAAEFLFCASMIGVHLSRLGEEIALWTSREFGWAELDDAYATGSSIMPQKKNPDVAELARGKSGRLIGNLTSLLVTLKGLPLRLQPRPAGGQGAGLRLGRHPAAGAAGSDRLRGDLAVPHRRDGSSRARGFRARHRRSGVVGAAGVPFRDAHEIAGAFVQAAEARGVDLEGLSDAELADVSPHLTPAVRDVLTVEGALASRSAFGGTAPVRVREQLAALRATLAET